MPSGREGPLKKNGAKKVGDGGKAARPPTFEATT